MPRPKPHEGVGVTVTTPAATATVGTAARIPDDAAPETVAEIKRLLRAEDALLNVSAWTRSETPLPTNVRARTVAAAGVAAMFCRPFTADNKKRRLDPAEWCARIADDPEQARMFDRLLLRRSKVFAHSDTKAGVVNITDTSRLFAGPRQPGDPLDLRVYNVGADNDLLEPESQRVIAELAERLAELFSARMVELGATRVRSLDPSA